ncbi:DUF2157 domain-containing protein [Neolewinella litorea]|uniref:DUF2157 domain-containing protein n=1 Tax=Neolewinella litorea TaxID=2562452 RepID=A0A4S4NJS7_9BACT|nr:DUF2157 domain-containing protein [Neolewinella litorea]THH40064.1 DUF2157 domain-containing protein [Neolewinella litorea]
MEAPTRYIVHLVARHSNWHPRDIDRTLRDDVYASRADWRQLLQYLLLGAGASFLLSGIFFFFAYNWAALPAPIKIGLPVGGFTLTALAGLFLPLGDLARRVTLTAAVVLIGAILAVLGQVYQTGANAYDLFLTWSVLTLPWLVAVRFAPLWLLFVGLINVTFITYTQQLGIELAYLVSGMLLFGFNLAAWGLIWWLFRWRTGFDWLLRVIAFWAVIIATINISAGAYDGQPWQLIFTVLLAAVTYAGWTWLSLQQRSIYYLALVGGGTLITLTFLILRWMDSAPGYLLAGTLLLVGITLLTRLLNHLNLGWRVR